MAWYRAGTVAVTNGSPVVTGTGTAFVANAQIGHAINLPDGNAYEVAAINSDTQITLGSNYLGATATGQGYSIQPNQGFAQYAAQAVSQFLTQYSGYLSGSLVGRFGDGTVAAPGITFSADQDTGLRRVSDNVAALVTGGADRLTVDGSGAFVTGSRMDVRGSTVANVTTSTSTANWSIGVPDSVNRWRVVENQFGSEMLSILPNGNIGVGTIAPASKSHVASSAATQLTIENTSGSGDNAVVYKTPSRQWNVGQNVGGAGTGCFNFYDVTAGASRVAIDTSGNLLINATSSLLGTHMIAKAAPAGFGIADFYSPTSTKHSLVVLAVDTEGYNTSQAAAWIGKNSGTGRSVNASGTINANGADYAEYMTKADGCGTIAKGDVCGVDTGGRLTRSWAAALSYRVKSTAPNLVGGDGWALHLGQPPVPPAPFGVEPTLAAAPTPYTDPHPLRAEDEEDEAFGARWAAWLVASQAAQAEQAAFDQQAEAFPALHAAWVEERDAFVAADAKYATDKATFDAALEAARQTVDRIAYCGQVPVNFTGECAAGDYLVAVEGEGDTISLIAVAAGAITFDQYRNRVGKVLAIGADGRPVIDVQHG